MHEPQFRSTGTPFLRNPQLIAAMIFIPIALLTGCSSGPSAAPTESSAPSISASPTGAPIADPHLEVGEEATVLTTVDGSNQRIDLTMPLATATISGVDQEIASSFADEVESTQQLDVQEQLDRYSTMDLHDCKTLDGGATSASAEEPCERTGEASVENAAIYGEYATIATRTRFFIGGSGKNNQVHSVTMNATTGTIAALDTFLNLSDPVDRERATSALVASNLGDGQLDWIEAACAAEPANETPDGYLDKVAAFSPSEEGLILLWAPPIEAPAQCQLDRVVVPWAGSDAAPAATRGANGHWCPTPESTAEQRCITIVGDSATFDDGTTFTLYPQGQQDGGFLLTFSDAPFGVYVPAGTPLDIPEYFPGADVPDQDRIWNGQTGVMLLRQS